MSFGILIDVTKCTGCERCVAACVDANGLDRVSAEADRATTLDGLSANRLVTVVPLDGGRFARKSCMHCEEPSCVSACLVGAIEKSDKGPVVYDPGKCIGCRYCMLACPFHVPRYEWAETTPYVKKCDMCFERVTGGGQPACVEACPQKAMSFGERAALLERAHRLLAESPGRYLPHVWGEEEFGGTGVLYVSDVDLSEMDWPDSSFVPIPHLTEPLIASTPFIGMAVASGLIGIHWVIRRRMKLATLQDRSGEPTNPENDDHEQ
jgi:formate dehydrogenase iron-sulfur subunit